MIINTTGMTANEVNIINKNGDYLLKLIKIEPAEYGKLKLHFEGAEIVEGKVQSDIVSMIEFCDTDKQIFKIVRLRDAFKSPELFNLDDWLNRYVVARVEMQEYNGKTSPNFKKLQYSSHNDKLPPIPEAKQEQSVGNDMANPSVEITEDSIPF